MFDSPLVLTLISYSGIGLAGLASCLVGASIYDIKESRDRYKIRQHPYSKQNRQKQLISIVIYANDARLSIENCLESILRSSYRNYEIIVIDDSLVSRRDGILKKSVLEFAGKRSKVVVRILSRRKKTSREEAIAAGIKKWARGSIIMNIDADSVLDKNALRNVNYQFISSDKESIVLLPHTQVASQPSILSLIQQTDQLLRSSTKKLISLAGFSHNPMASGAIYRRTAGTSRINQQNGGSRLLAKYASDVRLCLAPEASWAKMFRVTYLRKTEALRSIKALGTIIIKDGPIKFQKLHFFRFTISILFQAVIILTPLIITYLLYLAVYFKQSVLYSLSWIIFSVVFLAIIWGKDLIIRQKLALTGLAPVVYSLFYILSIVHAIGLIVAIINVNRIIFNKWQQAFAKHPALKAKA